MYVGLILGCLLSAPAPPPTAKEIAVALVENCNAPVSDKDRALLARSDVQKELNRLGVARGWLDPHTSSAGLSDEEKLLHAVTTLRFCRSMLRQSLK